MQKRSTLIVLAFFLMFALLLLIVVDTTSGINEQEEITLSLNKIEPAVFEAISTKSESNFVIEMSEHADLKAAYEIKDWSMRGWYVYNTLKEVADRTQAPILKVLEEKGVKYQSFFTGNEIAVTAGDMAVLAQIAALDSVEYIRYPRTAYIDPIPTLSQDLFNFTAQSLSWGINDTNADDFWATYGIQGDGIVVANIDTGVQWNHPALVQAYKCGTNPSDPNCWYDPSNICNGSMCDNNGHGTHTMGTMVGDDDPTLTYQVGMAPNAQWIACKGCENNICSDTALNACADWIIAPNSNPDNRPDIVNNSWGRGGGDNWYLTKVEAWRAAGIFPAFSTGNSGLTCGSLFSPGDYQESFGTAAHSKSRTIASFSSRGPGYFGHDPYTKPNISAPGDYICSSVPGNGWSCDYSGTSMASPHTAGAVALLWSCNSSLIGDMDTTFEVLQNTADTPPAGTCGAPADGEGNYTYGYGYLNVLAAGQQVCSVGTITGTVSSGSSPVEGATVTADNGAGVVVDTLTGADGVYTLNALAGTYTVTATKYGYDSDVETGVEVVENEEVTISFTINPLSSTTVSGVVYDAGVEGLGSHGYPLYASIHITASGFNQTIYSDPITGKYSIDLVSETEHTFETTAVISGYEPLVETVTPTTDALTHDIGLGVDGNVCAAHGYIGSGVNEGFESGTLPDGWVNYDYLGNGQVWQFDDPGGWGNLTPGANGGFAIVDSDNYGYGGSQDTGLRTPVMDFSGETIVTLDFDTAYNYYTGDSATVRVSDDSGATWTNVWSKNADFVDHVTLDISAQAAGKASVIVEFKYVGSWDWYWEVDDVLITPMNCELASGGAVAGFVIDANTGNPLIGADVYSDTAATQSFTLEGDPDNAGLYWLFQPTVTDSEDVVFTASKAPYANESATVSVVRDAVTQQDFALVVEILKLYLPIIAK